jgi:hypothetical protein
MWYLAIIVIWFIVGDGAYPKEWDGYINLFYVLSAIIFLFPVILVKMIINYRKKIFYKVKSYLIVSIVIVVESVVLSLFQFKG